MKFLIDQNLSYKLLRTIEESFPSSIHIAKLGFDNKSDKSIFDYAKENDYNILTKDIDFEELSVLYGCPPKIVRLQCGNKSTKVIAELLSNHIDHISEYLSDSTNCYMSLG